MNMYSFSSRPCLSSNTIDSVLTASSTNKVISTTKSPTFLRTIFVFLSLISLLHSSLAFAHRFCCCLLNAVGARSSSPPVQTLRRRQTSPATIISACVNHLDTRVVLKHKLGRNDRQTELKRSSNK